MGDVLYDDYGDMSLSPSALEALWPRTVRVLHGYLRGRSIDASTREDVIQDAFVKIWEKRTDIEFKSPSSWFAYCKRTVDHLIIDRSRSNSSTTISLEMLEEVEDQSPGFEAALTKTLQHDLISEVADDLWLGGRPDHHDLRLLAAVLILQDGQRAASVHRILTKESKGLPTDIIQLISHQRTLNEVLYRGVYLQPSEIATRVLGLRVDELCLAIEAISAGRNLVANGICWTPQELVIVLKKCSEYDSTSIVKRTASVNEGSPLEDTIVRINNSIPFMGIVKQIKCNGMVLGLPTHHWAKSGLWKRLAFQYTLDGLSHIDFQDWFTGAALQVGYEFKPCTVHGWISNRRLAQELAEELKTKWNLESDND